MMGVAGRKDTDYAAEKVSCEEVNIRVDNVNRVSLRKVSGEKRERSEGTQRGNRGGRGSRADTAGEGG